MASRKFIGNFVAIDAIHQDRVRKEQLAQKNWPKNHGYMIEEIKKTEEKLAQTGENCNADEEPNWKDQLPVTVGKSPKMPLTSSGQIGLRSTKADCLLDIYDGDGQQFKKSDILKRFKWPREGNMLI